MEKELMPVEWYGYLIKLLEQCPRNKEFLKIEISKFLFDNERTGHNKEGIMIDFFIENNVFTLSKWALRQKRYNFNDKGAKKLAFCHAIFQYALSNKSFITAYDEEPIIKLLESIKHG